MKLNLRTGIVVAACIVVSTGISFNFGDLGFFAIMLTIFWVSSVTNAFNLIDVMDGLSAGTAMVAALVLAVASDFNQGTTSAE